MQLGLFAAPDGSSGKTSPGRSAHTAVETLLQWLDRWQDASLMSPSMAGDLKAWRWGRAASSSGACSTRSGSEWRKGGAACSLSSTLETGQIDRRYYLSAKACAGIIRRAEKRGKELPPALSAALAAAAM